MGNGISILITLLIYKHMITGNIKRLFNSEFISKENINFLPQEALNIASRVNEGKEVSWCWLEG